MTTTNITEKHYVAEDVPLTGYQFSADQYQCLALETIDEDIPYFCVRWPTRLNVSDFAHHARALGLPAVAAGRDDKLSVLWTDEGHQDVELYVALATAHKRTDIGLLRLQLPGSAYTWASYPPEYRLSMESPFAGIITTHYDETEFRHYLEATATETVGEHLDELLARVGAHIADFPVGAMLR